MNKENTEKLLKRFPDLYRDYYLSPQQSCLCFGFECGDGWFKLLWDLSKKIEKYKITVIQVKEKFGGLRYYYYYGGEETKDEKNWDRVDKIIIAAENLSLKTCELCGKRGKPNTDGWMSVLCNKCRKARK